MQKKPWSGDAQLSILVDDDGVICGFGSADYTEEYRRHTRSLGGFRESFWVRFGRMPRQSNRRFQGRRDYLAPKTTMG